MNFRIALLAILCPFFFASCGDSPEKVTKDSLALMEDTAEILNKVADGSMSSADAAKKVGALSEKAEKLRKRSQTVMKDISPEDQKNLGEKFEQKTMKAFRDLMEASEKLEKSGRGTKELMDAIEKMDP